MTLYYKQKNSVYQKVTRFHNALDIMNKTLDWVIAMLKLLKCACVSMYLCQWVQVVFCCPISPDPFFITPVSVTIMKF